MCCIICYNSPIFNLNKKTQARRGFIIYNTITNIIALIKHVTLYHYNIFKKFDEEVNNLLREDERQP